jgi:hypothetical protein
MVERLALTDRQLTADNLAKVLAPFSYLYIKEANNPIYKALLLSPTGVRGCAPFGRMECRVPLAIDSPVHVLTKQFLQVVKSLPAAMLDIKVDGNALVWQCGQSDGELAIFPDDVALPEIPEVVGEPIVLPSDFGKRLSVGGLACGDTNLIGNGLYGIVFTPTDNGLYCYACDNINISQCRLTDEPITQSESFYLGPDAANLLAKIGNDADLVFDGQAVCCQTNEITCVLGQVPPLKQDVIGMAGRFLDTDISVPLNKQVISAFIKRCEALLVEGESKSKATVDIGISNGRTTLSFSNSGKTNKSTEYYLTDDAPDVEVTPVSIETQRIAQALSYSDQIVFDYASHRTLVLRGPNDFMFVMSGSHAE